MRVDELHIGAIRIVRHDYRTYAQVVYGHRKHRLTKGLGRLDDHNPTALLDACLAAAPGLDLDALAALLAANKCARWHENGATGQKIQFNA